MTRTETLAAIVAAERRARKITRLTAVQVGITPAGPSGHIVWVDGERIGPYPPHELDDILDGIELSAWTLADARDTTGAAA